MIYGMNNGSLQQGLLHDFEFSKYGGLCRVDYRFILTMVRLLLFLIFSLKNFKFSHL